MHFEVLELLLCSFIVTMVQFYKTLQLTEIQLLICFASLSDKKMVLQDK